MCAEQKVFLLANYDCVRFSDGCWYKFAKAGVTKENAIDEVKEVADIIIGRNDEDGIAEYLENFF